MQMEEGGGKRKEGRGRGTPFFLFFSFCFAHFSDFFSQEFSEAVRGASARRAARVHEVLVSELGSLRYFFVFLHITHFFSGALPFRKGVWEG